MSDKADRLESQLAELLEKLLIDLLTVGTRLDQVHHEILALDQIRPNVFLLGCRLADDRCAANSREVAVFLTEDLHTDQIPSSQLSIRRPDVGKLAPLTGRDDHQLITLRAPSKQ